jgi:redox-sensitive bicupin YhaK (pirin superfamily)
MAANVEEIPRTRIVLGRIRQSDVTTRTILPNPRRTPLDPFLRIIESIGTSRKAPVLHSHRGEEVALYVLEGAVEHLSGDGRRSVLGRGAVFLATAGAEFRHGLTVDRGRTAHWFSVVTSLPASLGSTDVSVAVVDTSHDTPGPEGAILRKLVGPQGAVVSPSGLRMEELRFIQPGTTFLALGPARRGFVYALRGEGRVGDLPISAGQGALLEPQAGVAIRGERGFAAIFGSGSSGAGVSEPAKPSSGVPIS